MKISFARGLALAVGLACGGSLEAQAQQVGYGSPSLLPLPSSQQDYSVQPVAAFKRFQAEEVGPTVGSPDGSGFVSAPEQAPAPLPPPPLPNQGPVSPFEAAMGGAWGDGSQASGCTDGSCHDGSCVADACCAPCSPWWTTGAFLWMGRSKEDSHQLSFNTLDPLGAVLTTDSANMNFSPGFQISMGRWFCDGAVGLEATYWGIYPENQQDIAYGGTPSNMNSVFNFGTLEIGPTNLQDLYDNAQAHRVTRSWAFHNLELNLLQGQGYNWDYGSCNRFNVGMIAGIRYFRFDEGFQYATAQTSPVFGVDPANEAFYDIDIENHLVGAQIGARGNWLVGNNWRLHAAPKFGVFNNHISQMQRIYNVNGIATIAPGNPLAGTAYDINNSKDEISFLAEVDLGVDYRISRHWSVNVGYRVVAITNVAMASTQIPPEFPDLPGVADIKNDESLFLHGGYAGATFAW